MLTRTARTGLALPCPTISRTRAPCSAQAPRLTVRASVERDAQPDVAPATLLAVTSMIAPWALDTGAAQAIGREYGIVEGQIFSLMHPAFMFFLFGSSLYAGYLGFQWRHTRELATEIKALKAQRPAAGVGPDGEPVPAPPSAVDTQITELEKVRAIALRLHAALLCACQPPPLAVASRPALCGLCCRSARSWWVNA